MFKVTVGRLSANNITNETMKLIKAMDFKVLNRNSFYLVHIITNTLFSIFHIYRKLHEF